MREQFEMAFVVIFWNVEIEDLFSISESFKMTHYWLASITNTRKLSTSQTNHFHAKLSVFHTDSQRTITHSEKRQTMSLMLHRKSCPKRENPIELCAAYVSSCSASYWDDKWRAHCCFPFIVLHTTTLARVRYCCCWMALYQNTTVCRPFSIRRALNTNGWTNTSIVSICKWNFGFAWIQFFSNEDQRLPNHHKLLKLNGNHMNHKL